MKNHILRTDLALENTGMCDNCLPKGVFTSEERIKNILKTTVKIETDEAEKRLFRKKGTYITLEGDFFYEDEFVYLLEKELIPFLPSGKILVAGVGNLNITPDSLGPLSAKNVLATSHLRNDFKEAVGLENLRSVSVSFPGSSGETGLETGKILKALIDEFSFSCLIVIDALASLAMERLGRTIQVTDAGISPGSGVGNRRSTINKDTMGIPVIAIGVPTVTDAFSLLGEKALKENMILAPKDIDLIIKRASSLIGRALNFSLQSEIDKEALKFLI